MGTGVRALVEDVFRRSSGRLVAQLTRVLGPQNLELAEEVVQDALISALQKWPWSGIPDHPEAWLFRVARNRALDSLRRSQKWEAKVDDDVLISMAEGLADLDAPQQTGPGSPLGDDELAMVFMCCHPSLPADGAVALTLRTVGGLSTREIASAFLVPEATMAQRIVRAKRRFAELAAPVALPSADAIPARKSRVLKVLYLMFNEGYSASDGESWVRAELCREAIRLGELLAQHPATTGPDVDALMALFLFQASRLAARTDAGGGVISLEHQDRTLWDRDRITRGFMHLDRARSGEVTPLHLEAGIAAEHAMAASLEGTNWARIIGFYDRLWTMAPSGVVAVNRAIAIGMGTGPEQGLEALTLIEQGSDADSMIDAARGFLLARTGRSAEAAAAFRRAASTTNSEPVQRFLTARAAALEAVG